MVKSDFHEVGATIMSDFRMSELEDKQVLDTIASLYQTLSDDEDILTPPDNDSGIFKYNGFSEDAQFHLTKMCKKRDVKRTGLGFVIQRATLSDRFRISFDVEISPEVTGKDTAKLIEFMNVYLNDRFGVRSPELIVYHQPAHSGQRGWETKTFVGIEIDLTEGDLNAPQKSEKKLLHAMKQIFQALDYALIND